MLGPQMNDEFKDIEGSGRGLIEAVPRHLHEETEENYWTFQLRYLYPSRESNRTPPELK
jgi:hypothetical protein